MKVPCEVTGILYKHDQRLKFYNRKTQVKDTSDVTRHNEICSFRLLQCSGKNFRYDVMFKKQCVAEEALEGLKYKQLMTQSPIILVLN